MSMTLLSPHHNPIAGKSNSAAIQKNNQFPLSNSQVPPPFSAPTSTAVTNNSTMTTTYATVVTQQPPPLPQYFEPLIVQQQQVCSDVVGSSQNGGTSIQQHGPPPPPGMGIVGSGISDGKILVPVGTQVHHCPNSIIGPQQGQHHQSVTTVTGPQQCHNTSLVTGSNNFHHQGTAPGQPSLGSFQCHHPTNVGSFHHPGGPTAIQITPSWIQSDHSVFKNF